MFSWILGCTEPAPVSFDEALRRQDRGAISRWLPDRAVRRWLSLRPPGDEIRLDALDVDLLGSTVRMDAQLVAEPGRWADDVLPLGTLLVTDGGWVPIEAWSTLHDIDAAIDIALPYLAGEATLRVDGSRGVVGFELHDSPADVGDDGIPAIELVEVTQDGVPCPWSGWRYQWVVGLPFPDADTTLHLRWRYLPHPGHNDIVEDEKVELYATSGWMPGPMYGAMAPTTVVLNGIDGLAVRAAEQDGRTLFAAPTWPGTSVALGPMVVDVAVAPEHEADTLERLAAGWEALEPLVARERMPERLLVTETREGRPAYSPRGTIGLPFPFADRLPWVTAHELVHQAAGWRYGPSHDSPFTPEEAVAEHLALRSGSAAEALAWRQQMRISLGRTPASGERPMLDVAGPGEYRYARGGLLFEALELQIGRDVMDDVLREAFRGRSFDWFDLIDAVAARDAGGGRWLGAWLEAATMPELSVRETADGGWELVDHANTDLPGTIEVVPMHRSFGADAPLRVRLDRLPARLEGRGGSTFAIDPDVRWPIRVR